MLKCTQVICEKCSKSFSSRSNLSRHIRFVHDREAKIFTCRYECGKIFSTKWYEKTHAEKYCLVRGKCSQNVEYSEENRTPKRKKIEDTSTQDDQIDEKQIYFLSIKTFLPEGYDYKLLKCYVSKCAFTFKVDSVQDCENWIKKFQDEMQIDFRILYLPKTKNPVILLKKKFRCHHNTRNNALKNPKKSKKDTNCPWQLYIAAHLNPQTQIINVLVKLTNEHNHRLKSLENAKYRHPGEDVVIEFKKLFEEGMTVDRAYKAYYTKLKNEIGDEFFQALGNRKLLPDRGWVQTLYAKFGGKTYRIAKNERADMLKALQQRLIKYNEKEGAVCTSFLRLTEKENFVAVIQTHFMKRVCNDNPLSKEILCIDSSGAIDRFGCQVFLLMTNSSAGALPITIFVMKNESEEMIANAIDLWKKNFLTSDSFNGNGLHGPKIIILNDSAAERNSFSSEFPQATLFLCSFRMMQALWRNIWNANDKVCDNDRRKIMILVKNLLYCEDWDRLDEMFNALTQNNLFQKYSFLNEFVTQLLQRKKEWALCYRNDFIACKQHTNIYDATMRVMKERILERTNAYTPAQLIDFILTEFNEYYIDKLIDVATGRPTKYLTSIDEFYRKKLSSLRIAIEHDDGIEYDVYNEASNSFYTVNTDYGTCSCAHFIATSGKNKLCEHLWYVYTQKKVDIVTETPKSEVKKKVLMKIALGDQIERYVPEEWFKPLPVSAENPPENRCENMTAVIANDNVVEVEIESVDFSDTENEDGWKSCEMYQEMHSDEILKKFNGVGEEIIELAKTDRLVLEGVRQFVDNYHKIKTNVELVNALTTFSMFALTSKKPS